MAATKGKRQVSFLIDERVLDRVDQWRSRQEIAPAKTAVLELALREFLERREEKKKKPAE